MPILGSTNMFLQSPNQKYMHPRRDTRVVSGRLGTANEKKRGDFTRSDLQYSSPLCNFTAMVQTV